MTSLFYPKKLVLGIHSICRSQVVVGSLEAVLARVWFQGIDELPGQKEPTISITNSMTRVIDYELIFRTVVVLEELVKRAIQLHLWASVIVKLCLGNVEVVCSSED